MANAGRQHHEAVLESASLAEDPCPMCESTDVMRITISLDGEPVSVRYCAKCETREWSRAGATVDLDYLLPAMRATTRKRA
ncbi:MAG: hypothetical protein ABR600_05885 [Actinomycetota bacterium]